MIARTGKNDPGIYLVIPTTNIGGAEKRFLGLWLHWKRQGIRHIQPIMPRVLFERAAEIAELAEIDSHRDDIILLEWKGRFRRLIPDLFKMVRSRKTPSLFHYVALFPPFIHWFSGQHTLFTIPSTSIGLDLFPPRTLFYLYNGICQSGHLDILDPTVYEKIKRWRRHHDLLHLTPGSFVDMKTYRAPSAEQKKNWLVFLGRFAARDLKNAVPFVRSLPVIDRRLKDSGIEATFFILGHGPREEELRRLMETPPYRGISMKLYFEDNPQDILKYSKVFYSLQINTNYPSKSLLEALACGNLAVVTDVGSTRKIAREEFSYYVNEDFTPEEIAARTLEAMALTDGEFESKASAAVDFVSSEFTIDSVSSYYLNLYDRITERH